MGNEFFKSKREFLEYILSGKKFRHFNWYKDSYDYFTDDGFYQGSGQKSPFNFLVIEEYNNFQPYIEPKKKKQITLYRYTHKTINEIYQSPWVSEERTLTENIILVETKTIEVNDDQTIP